MSNKINHIKNDIGGLSHRMRGHHLGTDETGLFAGNIKKLNHSLAHMELVEGWESHNKKGNVNGGVDHFITKNGVDVYVRYNRPGRVIDITSDNDEENQDEDDVNQSEMDKFSSKMIKQTVHQIQKLVEDKTGVSTFKKAVAKSLTKFTEPFKNMKDVFVKNPTTNLWDKAVDTWEHMKGREMTDVGKGKLYDFIDKVRKAIVNKHKWSDMIVKLDEDTDIVSFAKLIGMVFA